MLRLVFVVMVVCLDLGVPLKDAGSWAGEVEFLARIGGGFRRIVGQLVCGMLLPQSPSC